MNIFFVLLSKNYSFVILFKPEKKCTKCHHAKYNFKFWVYVWGFATIFF